MWCKVACDYSVFHIFFVMLRALTVRKGYIGLISTCTVYSPYTCKWIQRYMYMLRLWSSLLLIQHSAKCNSSHQIDEKPEPRKATCYSICMKKPTLMTIFYWQKKTPSTTLTAKIFCCIYCIGWHNFLSPIFSDRK